MSPLALSLKCYILCVVCCVLHVELFINVISYLFFTCVELLCVISYSIHPSRGVTHDLLVYPCLSSCLYTQSPMCPWLSSCYTQSPMYPCSSSCYTQYLIHYLLYRCWLRDQTLFADHSLSRVDRLGLTGERKRASRERGCIPHSIPRASIAPGPWGLGAERAAAHNAQTDVLGSGWVESEGL